MIALRLILGMTCRVPRRGACKMSIGLSVCLDIFQPIRLATSMQAAFLRGCLRLILS